jgi:hypothetical protein
MNPTGLLVLSHATYVGASGATAAATYKFMTKGYEPPAQTRHTDFDIVHNQNGKFKYVYDNGPGFRRWPAFMITCQDKFQAIIGANAATQYQRLSELWDYRGILGMSAPEGTYSIHWAIDPIEQNFIQFPKQVGDVIERDISVQFEEG